MSQLLLSQRVRLCANLCWSDLETSSCAVAVSGRLHTAVDNRPNIHNVLVRIYPPIFTVAIVVSKNKKQGICLSVSGGSQELASYTRNLLPFRNTNGEVSPIHRSVLLANAGSNDRSCTILISRGLYRPELIMRFQHCTSITRIQRRTSCIVCHCLRRSFPGNPLCVAVRADRIGGIL